MSGNRFRYIDPWHYTNVNKESATQQAADETIQTPEKHLLTQDEIFQAEGGPAGLLVQGAGTLIGLSLLFAFRPNLLRYLRNAQLRPLEWVTVGGTALLSYNTSHYVGAQFFGDNQKLRNHWVAYFYVKQLNRFEGRQILKKAPAFY